MVAAYDNKLQAYLRLFTSPTIGAAERAFITEVKNPESQLNRNPEDFKLDHIGHFDDETGHVRALEHGPQTIITAIDALKKGAA